MMTETENPAAELTRNARDGDMVEFSTEDGEELSGRATYVGGGEVPYVDVLPGHTEDVTGTGGERFRIMANGDIGHADGSSDAWTEYGALDAATLAPISEESDADALEILGLGDVTEGDSVTVAYSGHERERIQLTGEVTNVGVNREGRHVNAVVEFSGGDSADTWDGEESGEYRITATSDYCSPVMAYSVSEFQAEHGFRGTALGKVTEFSA